ncbi:type II toxin-antitoxin system HicA family toxin [Frankia sp. Cas4]|uniref:type II toxin-antitoxin system HicA family toxin n=1 Tax=Frankia sp. Cas4 TaxID=3073927 RepID=UPI002AD586E3|nr:type II toxin-antitoxin system HicA family toxin [Frankia sp. Cas4]
MPPLPVVSGAEVVKALEKEGFELVRIRGSHHMMKNPEGRFTVVPVHQGKDIPPGTLRRIIRDAGMSVAEFIALL